MAKRRRYGRGGLTRRANGTWRATLYLDGQQVQRTFPSRDEAEVWLADMKPVKATADRFGLASEGSQPDLTFTEGARLLEGVWKARRKRVWTENTLRGYRSDLNHVLAEFGERRIRDLRPTHLDEYAAKMRADGLTTATLAHRLTMLKQIVKAAVDAGAIAAPPCEITRPRLVQSSERICTTEEDFGKLLAAAKEHPRWLALLLLASDAGLRREEIGRVRGRDLRLNVEGDGETFGNVHVAVRGEVERTKSGKARDVPILTARLAQALAALSPEPEKTVLRTAPTGEGVRHLADKLWKAAGLGADAQLHELRHRWVTRLLEAGEPAINVQRWAGHKDLATTQRYAHPSGRPSRGVGRALECGPIVART